MYYHISQSEMAMYMQLYAVYYMYVVRLHLTQCITSREKQMLRQDYVNKPINDN